MRAELVRIGNSRGIRIPKPIIEQCGLEGEVELQVDNGRLVVAAARRPREGWEEAFRAADSSHRDELLTGSFPNQFDQDEWRW